MKPKRKMKDTIAADLPFPDFISEKAQDELLRLADASARAKPENTLGRLDRRRILYYPGAGRDFTPLSRLTHLYDTFIYADYGIDNPDFRDLAGWIEDAAPGKTGLKVTDIELLPPELLETLGRDPIHEVAPRPDQNRENAAWGVHVRLTRRIGPVERLIDLFYLGLEGVTVYRNLFTKTCTAPRGVCFISTDGFAGNHTTFGRWSQCFGAVVRQNPCKPEFVIHAHGDYDWPWNSVWQTHSDWRCMHGGTPTTYALPVARVTDAGDAQAVTTQLHRDRSQSGFEIVVRRGFEQPRVVCEIHRGNRSLPLDAAINEQINLAQANQATEIHCILRGFEDEGCALERLYAAGRNGLTLFIHCDNEGDAASFVPYCSRVESRNGAAPLDPRPH